MEEDNLSQQNIKNKKLHIVNTTAKFMLGLCVIFSIFSIILFIIGGYILMVFAFLFPMLVVLVIFSLLCSFLIENNSSLKLKLIGTSIILSIILFSFWYKEYQNEKIIQAHDDDYIQGLNQRNSINKFYIEYFKKPHTITEVGNNNYYDNNPNQGNLYIILENKVKVYFAHVQKNKDYNLEIQKANLIGKTVMVSFSNANSITDFNPKNPNAMDVIDSVKVSLNGKPLGTYISSDSINN